MKKKFHLTFLLLMIVILAGCKGDTTFRDLAVCGSYAVPGMFCFELKGGTYDTTVIEEDTQGRILFSYTTESLITEEKETAVVICQAMDSKYVYFYEDICYLTGEYSDEDMESLKEQNDWDCALDYDKMTKRENKVSFDLFLIYDSGLDAWKLREICSEEFEIEENEIKDFCFLDSNQEGQELCILILQKENIVEKYYVLANQEYEIAYMPIEDGHADAAVLASFKRENGWYDEVE